MHIQTNDKHPPKMVHSPQHHRNTPSKGAMVALPRLRTSYCGGEENKEDSVS